MQPLRIAIRVQGRQPQPGSLQVHAVYLPGIVLRAGTIQYALPI